MREKIADKKERILKIIEIFGKVYSDADCTLEYLIITEKFHVKWKTC